MKLVFASHNTHKIEEIKRLLPNTIEILSLTDIGCVVDIPETAATIEGNAKMKADYIKRHYGYDCFADDSGLEVDALQGAPGVYSARYAGEEKDDLKNMNKLLREMEAHTNRKANFKTVIALHFQGEEQVFTGTVHGEILREAKGTNGFGYDPVFQAQGMDKSFAELSLEQKSQISHRGQAVQLLLNFLKDRI